MWSIKSRVGVAKLGINVTAFPFTKPEVRALAKADLRSVASISPTTLVLVSSARLDTQKRPLLVPEIILEVKARLKQVACSFDNVVMLMIGSGALHDALVETINGHSLAENVVLLGTSQDPSHTLRGSDIFLLPSAIEGISIAVAEAMALGLPIVTSFAGGLPEQLGNLGAGKAIAGRLITLAEDTSQDVLGYVDAVMELACDDTQRLAMGRSARTFVEKTFDQDYTLPQFNEQMVLARNPEEQSDSPVSLDSIVCMP